MIGEGGAREIAADWHGGQSTGLYAFASSGYVSVDAVSEAEHDLRRSQGTFAREELSALIEYLTDAGAYDECEACDGYGEITPRVIVTRAAPHLDNEGRTLRCPRCKGDGYARTL